uniref:GYF domain-containing protein n=1 Tax=Musca domestica TaxID=7370 RepID=A0A1I8NI61_MUSDO
MKRNSGFNVDDCCTVNRKKHTLDSDEEDSDEYERDDDDVDGEEDGDPTIRDDVKITPFNMREELEEGHFDKDGHFHWNKNTNIRDNWLDNIDWVKIDENGVKKCDEKDDVIPATKESNMCNIYIQILQCMEKSETVSQTLRRLDKNRKKMGTAERLKHKKSMPDVNGDTILKLTGLINHILTETGNMDVYDMSYESIESVIGSTPGSSKTEVSNLSLDMYSDDFDSKEHNSKLNISKYAKTVQGADVLWEFKRLQTDVNCEGPYNTTKMYELSSKGEFGRNGVYVRKVGEEKFYNSRRIHFDLYL